MNVSGNVPLAAAVADNPFGGVPGQEGTDAVFIIISSFIIFTMLSGFGLLESGMVSAKCEANVIIKYMVAVALGGIAYWFIGYGFSFGENTNESSNGFIGFGDFITDVEIDTTKSEAITYTKFVFQLSFATTATTIVSGAAAERIKLGCYMLFIVINFSIIYTIPVHWMWSATGWLGTRGASDFAGSSVVHMSGGASGFAAALIIGPRNYRFTTQEEERFRMSSPTNAVLGTFFLWWGWIGFNCGSAFTITGTAWRIVGRIAVVTMNGAMGGGASVVLLNSLLQLTKKRHYFLDIAEFTCGILGGLVAITGGCNQLRPWEGLVIGFIGGLIAVGGNHLILRMKVDDPVGCIGVHWGAGLWGMIATGLFGMDGGVFRGGDGTMLAYNLVACICVTLWSFGFTAIIFGFLNWTEKFGFGLRLSEEDEELGSDLVEHNIHEPVRGVTDVSKVRRQSSAFGKKIVFLAGRRPSCLQDVEEGDDVGGVEGIDNTKDDAGDTTSPTSS